MSKDATARQEFFKEHGNYIVCDGEFLFEDGARAEGSTLNIAVLIEPPDDTWECAKIVWRYYDALAIASQQKFLEYKRFLMGQGPQPHEEQSDEQRIAAIKNHMCGRGPHPEDVPYRSPDEQLAHLQELRNKAQTAKRYARAARFAFSTGARP